MSVKIGVNTKTLDMFKIIEGKKSNFLNLSQ